MSSKIHIDDGLAAISAYAEYEKKRRKIEREELIQAVSKVPVSGPALARIIWLPPGDAEEVLRHHPGYSIDEVLSSLRYMLDVFRRSRRDLSGHLNRFVTFAKDRDPARPSRSKELDEIQSDVRKEVFCLSSASMSLVAISQKLDKKVPVPGYRDRVIREFVDDPEHNFVKELRNNLNHGWFAAADWMMSNGPEGWSGTFTFSCPELLHNGDFNAKAKDYIRLAGEHIDVCLLFDSYSTKVEASYEWLISVIKPHLPASVADYRRCVRARKQNGVRSGWRLILEQIAIPKAMNPYDYLDRYLDEEQIAEVRTLPHRSVAQVDRIIELVDEYEACDDELRKLIYRLFKVNGFTDS